MAYWTNKHWGAVIGAALVISIALIGLGITALAVLLGLGGYCVGKFLDGELDLEEVRARAQGRFQRNEQANVSGAGPRTEGSVSGIGTAAGQPADAQPPGTGRVR